jgi:hypothetical protein
VCDICLDLTAQDRECCEAAKAISGHATHVDGRSQDALRNLPIFDRGDDVELGHEPKLTHEFPDVRFIARLGSTELVRVEKQPHAVWWGSGPRSDGIARLIM